MKKSEIFRRAAVAVLDSEYLSGKEKVEIIEELLDQRYLAKLVEDAAEKRARDEAR
jgi:hypothetical protein